GKIFWEVKSAEGDMENRAFLLFSVTYTGRGFSANALKHAVEQFYMDDGSRHANAHYGIGLFMADLTAKQHGGQLFLENSPETGGARVTMKIPC
ncbi:MAG: sensor histidine kinase, partial [Lachnospiraceae bacterium]|nr:sensor histidine kinase [Lachnospiraceae bacterium]